MYGDGVIVSESSMNKYNIFADPLCFEIKNRRGKVLKLPAIAGSRQLFRTDNYYYFLKRMLRK
jgi:hypothetical protein